MIIKKFSNFLINESLDTIEIHLSHIFSDMEDNGFIVELKKLGWFSSKSEEIYRVIIISPPNVTNSNSYLKHYPTFKLGDIFDLILTSKNYIESQDCYLGKAEGRYEGYSGFEYPVVYQLNDPVFISECENGDMLNQCNENLFKITIEFKKPTQS